MERSTSPVWASRVSHSNSQSSRTRGARSIEPGPSRYRTGVDLSDVPPVPSLERRESQTNPFSDTLLHRSDSIAAARESLELHPDIAPRPNPRTGILPFRLDTTTHRGVAAPWWQRSIEVPLSTSNIALIVASFGCLLGVIALGVAVRADTRDPVRDDLRHTNSTLAAAIAAIVAATLNAGRNATRDA